MPTRLTERRRVRVTGTVQGVGFRPFVYRQATELGLAGTVRNDSGGVLIEVEGPPTAIAELCRRVAEESPPLARVESVEATLVQPVGGPSVFAIAESLDTGAPEVPIGIDVATCADCLAEMGDPRDRRHAYPFTNCTNCGPRYTIITAVPYDRAATTMAGFRMCEQCRREHDDPADRRFHAQPNACPDCGPSVRLCSPVGAVLAEEDDAVTGAATAIANGRIVAVKGLGGFHLAADATRAAAVAELRRRKHRDDKPFAVMVPDIGVAGLVCELDSVAAQALESARRPIVLAPRRADGLNVADGVAPGLPELGVMLPYTPLHHLLLARVGRPIVLTSGNLSDEPIAHVDRDAFDRLGPLVDAVLTHDRPIHIRADDSVVRATTGRLQVLRRSRGLAPEPLTLPGGARRPVLAVGAELKNTVSVVTGDLLVTSHHIGDLEHPAAYMSFRQAVEHLCRVFAVAPDVVAHDLHPEYLSTKWALETDLPTVGVQHHHAHVASCLAEHRRSDPVLGVAFDGLGFGCDRSLWGGEFLVADLDGFTRVAHLRTCPLPGGAAAIREPWRMGLAWALTALGDDAADAEARRLGEKGHDLLSVLAGGEAAPTSSTSSVGRLFDAVAALLGIRRRVSYEGQAAIELEALARGVPRPAAPVYPVDRAAGEMPALDPAPLVASVVAARDQGVSVDVIAAGFHEGLGRAAAALAADLAAEHGLDTVALSGGVFQNARLTEVMASDLRDAGLAVLLHRHVPPNDGGISIGQAAVAATLEELPER